MFRIGLSLALCAGALGAQPVSHLTASWFGNSDADDQTFMPQGLEGMYVTPDGTVYTNIYWEEGGGQLTEVKDGKVKHGWGSHGWGHEGGTGVAANSRYVFFAQVYGNEGGGLVGADAYPPKGKAWWGIARRLRSDITAGAPFEGGKGGGGAPVGSFLPVFELPDSMRNDVVGLRGFAASDSELFAASPFDSTIKVYDAGTLRLKRAFPCVNPYLLALDRRENLWVTSGYRATSIFCYGRDGAKRPAEIHLPSGSFCGSLAIDPKQDRLLLGDVGQNEQVLIYTGLATTPVQSATFGTKFGIFSGVPGRVAPLKLSQVMGLGVDTLGNIYVGNTQWPTNGPGLVLEKYSPGGSLLWSRYDVEFVDCAGMDPATDGKDIFGPAEHFTVDFTRPPGQEATYAGFTVNRYKYPEDPRLKIVSQSSMLRTIGGKRFMYTFNQGSLSPLGIFRFNEATDGEVAIPCVITDGGKGNWGNAPDSWWMWRDLNANGRVEAGEFTRTEAFSVPDGGYSASVEENGTIWTAVGDRIRRIACKGLDPNGVPLYDGVADTFAVPAPLTRARRIRYDAANDILYLGGNTATLGNGHWMTMGKTIGRYDHWSQGNRQAAYTITCNYTGTSNQEPIAFEIAGDYIFVVLCEAGPTWGRGHIDIYAQRDGSMVGSIDSPWSGVGIPDMVEPLHVYLRSNGEYDLIQEEDGKNKNLFYRWCPSGECKELPSQVKGLSKPRLKRTFSASGAYPGWLIRGREDANGEARAFDLQGKVIPARKIAGGGWARLPSGPDGAPRVQAGGDSAMVPKAPK